MCCYSSREPTDNNANDRNDRALFRFELMLTNTYSLIYIFRIVHQIRHNPRRNESMPLTKSPAFLVPADSILNVCSGLEGPSVFVNIYEL